jgi:hypothetical protein
MTSKGRAMILCGRTVRLLLGVLTPLASSGCSLQSRAVTAASAAWSCPEDRIEVVSMGGPNGAEPQPPADVAADPARLDVWKRNRPDPSDVREFSASGCGRTGTIECRYTFDVANQNLHWVCVPTATVVQRLELLSRSRLTSQPAPVADPAPSHSEQSPSPAPTAQ